MKYKGEDTIWIRSQNKEELVKCMAFSVTRNIGGKKKSAIVGVTSDRFWGRKEVVLGLYDTREIALDELTRLQTELVNKTEVYEMS